MKKSFVRLTGFGIVIVLMIFVATRNGWSQEAGKQPPAEGNASKQPASAGAGLIELKPDPKDHGGFFDARAYQQHVPEIPSSIADGTG